MPDQNFFLNQNVKLAGECIAQFVWWGIDHLTPLKKGHIMEQDNVESEVAVGYNNPELS
jgi:hypothetical protein